MKILSIARRVLLGAALSLASLGAISADLGQAVRPDHPESYTVVKGDTLWDISGRFLEKPWLWPELWRKNPHIQNPHLIYPGDRIYLVWVDGEPQFGLERGDGGRTYKMSPGGTERLEPTIRSTPLESAIPAIRLEAIESFLVQNRVVTPEELEAAPYVLQGESERLVAGAGDQVFVRGVLPDGERFSIVRSGPVYTDPESGEVLGLEATYIGLGDSVGQDGDIATLRVGEVREEVRNADRILPTEHRSLDAKFYPRAPEVDVAGQVISVFGGVSQIGTFDVVVLNRGEREGLAVGDTLAIFRRGAVVRDPVTREQVALPSQRGGLLMVFRTFEKLAYGVVLQADRPLAVGDEVRNP